MTVWFAHVGGSTLYILEIKEQNLDSKIWLQSFLNTTVSLGGWEQKNKNKKEIENSDIR